MEYGKKEITEVLDEEGSKRTQSLNVVKGVASRPVRVRYEIRKRVSSDLEEQEAYFNFSREFNNDKSMLDPAFCIDKSKVGDANGYYYVVCCYTRLEY